MKLCFNNTNSTLHRSFPIFSLTIFTKLFLFFALFKAIQNKTTEKKTQIKTPDDLESIFRIFFDSKSKECFNEINFIYKKDFSNKTFSNPYKILTPLDKNLNRTLTQISKKLTKYNFYEGKNFTGIRWINPRAYSGELRRLMEVNLNHITEYFEKKYFNCKSTVPEFILENYNFFFSKFSEIKKSFQKFYIFKGIKKFIKCMSKSDNSFLIDNFSENFINGKITVKKMLTNLKNIVQAIMDLIKMDDGIDNFGKALKKIIVNLKGIPVL